MLQVLPDASEEEIARYEKRIQEMPLFQVGLHQRTTIEALLNAIYGNDEYKRLSEEDLRFACDCSRQRFEEALATLGKTELQEMQEQDHGADYLSVLR